MFFSKPKPSDLADKAHAAFERGMHLEEKGDIKKAVSAYKGSIKLASEAGTEEAKETLALAQYNLGVNLKSLGKTEEAIYAWKEAGLVGRETQYANALSASAAGSFNIAINFDKLGNLEEANVFYNEAILAGRQGGPWGWGVAANAAVNRGINFSRLVKSREISKELWRIAIELGEPADEFGLEGATKAAHNLGSFYEEGGKMEEAIEYYKEAIAYGKKSGTKEAKAIIKIAEGALNRIGK